MNILQCKSESIFLLSGCRGKGLQILGPHKWSFVFHETLAPQCMTSKTWNHVYFKKDPICRDR